MSDDDLKHLLHVQERIEKLVAGLGHDVGCGAERRVSVGDQFCADRAERRRLRRNELARRRYAARKRIVDIERRIDQLVADRANDAALPPDQRAEVRRLRKNQLARERRALLKATAPSRIENRDPLQILRDRHPDLTDEEIEDLVQGL